MAKKKLKHAETLAEALVQVFQYSDADIRANRKGIITNDQIELMRAKHADDRDLARLGFLFIAGIGYLGSGVAAIQEGIPILEMWGWVSLALFLLVLAIWFMLAFSRAKLDRTIRAGKVGEVSGPLWLKMEGNKPRVHYLCVGQYRFQIEAREYFYLSRFDMGGWSAMLYYTSPWVKVLSLELLNVTQ